ncbi:hypothetical protein QFC21_003633 [Naganishia friedmannii]|uniref:Uncharacterized protein n=1 Tax=Naganishia friedmannii TaxID=89922 RepID=A0ACC2VNM9_9TREE|nr:hypothetical protein QFC21_003633 [Naganishia friedmannii]
MELPPSHKNHHQKNVNTGGDLDDNNTIVARIPHAPTAWGANFWVVLADPVTEHTFYACPATGDCSWDPPVHAMVLPRNAAETLTKKTQWTRPTDVLVIPLAQIQTQLQVLRNTPRSIPPGTAVHSSSPPPLTTTMIPTTTDIRLTPRTPYPRSAIVKDDRGERTLTIGFEDVAAVDVDLAHKRSRSVFPALSSHSLGQANHHIQPTRPTDQNQNGEKTLSFCGSCIGKGIAIEPNTASNAEVGTPDQQEVTNGESGFREVGTRGTSTAISQESPSLPGRLSAFTRQEDPFDPSAQRASFASSGGKLVLPAIAADSHYPNEYFAVHRKGIARRRLTQQELMQWQTRPFAGPLLAKTTALSAVECPKIFKVIQHVMGERDSPVEGIVPPKPSEAATRLLAKQKSETAAEDRDHAWEKVERTMLLDEMRWLLHVSIRYPYLRDEVYAMAIKQATGNPLRQVFTRQFVLHNDNVFEPYVRTFLVLHETQEDSEIQMMARREIENAGEVASIGSMFGESLQTVMYQQAEHYPHLRVPVVLAHSAKAIIQSGGLNTAGVFLTMGDPDVVSEVRARFDRYQDGLSLDDITDPHVMASVLQLWLRELEEPLIPDDLYWDCLQVAPNPHMCCLMIRQLPLLNRHCFIYLLGFLQLFLAPDIVAKSRTTAESLAIIVAPNIFRRPRYTQDTILVTPEQESSFVLTVLNYLDISQLEPQVAPDLPKVGTFRGNGVDE